ncbi:MAG: hypothetical protein NT076_05590 [Candidatus Pacearchaeota archaeon]|nr:hypothetical protein [Candidatus Pacearchaeota archaeon]
MKKVFLLALILLIVPLVLAVSTPILIKAPSGLNVTINVVKTQDDLPLKTYQVITNSGNEANLIHESDFSGSIYLTIAARQNGKLYSYNETSPIYKSISFYSGNAITIDYIRAPVQPPAPVTPNITEQPSQTNDTPVQETITPTSDTTATGNSVLENIPFKAIGMYAAYIIGGIIIIGILIIFIMKVAVPFIQSNPLKKAEFSGYSSINLKDKNVERDLEKAEIKLKEAQVEIDKIKNKRNEVKDAEAKFLAAKKELERVKGKI